MEKIYRGHHFSALSKISLWCLIKERQYRQILFWYHKPHSITCLMNELGSTSGIDYISCIWHFRNFWSSMVFKFDKFIWPFKLFFETSVTDETFVDTVRRKYKISIRVSMISLSLYTRIHKLYKRPSKPRYIARSFMFSTKSLSKLLTSIVSAI